jgi:leader peptidase (prepilin peptidase)/N-methyltransferase
MPEDIRLELFWMMTAWVAVLGACVGSFLNVVVWRLPRGESLVRPGSHCPRCGKTIRPWENIPLLSWLWLRGRCSGCAQPISVRYPLVELTTLLLFLAVWMPIGRSPVLPWGLAVPGMALAALLLAAALTDVEHRLIPDGLVWTGLGVTLMLAAGAGWRPGVPWSWLGFGGWDGGDLLAAGIWEKLGIVPAAGPFGARWLAVAEVVCGALAGAVLLGSVRWCGGALWGVRRWRFTPARACRLEAGMVRVDGWLTAVPAELWRAGTDAIRLQVAPATGLTDNGGEAAAALEAELTPEGVRLNGQRMVVWADLKPISGQVVAAAVRREALGLGDVKLAAMLGAFLGGGGLFFAVMLGTIVALAVGLIILGWRGFRPEVAPVLPFGAFLAAGGLAWWLAGDRLLALLMCLVGWLYSLPAVL